MNRTARLAALIVPAAFSAAGAHAQLATSQPKSFPVVGTAPTVCTLSAVQQSGSRLLNMRGINGNAFEIDTMVNSATLSTEAASVDLTMQVVCNAPHRVRLETENNGLWRTSEITPQAPQGFATAVPYTLDVRWGTVSGRLDANAGVRGLQRTFLPREEALVGDMQMRFQVQAGATNLQANAPLIAGTYSDIVRITLEPQQ